MSTTSLNLFDEYTKRWFLKSLGVPTNVQEEAWPAIEAGKDTLVSAPTGTGKTLSAFLVFIDRLKAMQREGTLKQELYLIYVSPLKSLAGDIRENLKRPLDGILAEELKDNEKSHTMPYDIHVAIRTGDTTQTERRRMIKTPPHILITTPESLYLLLTSKTGKEMLKTSKAIIIDELHAMIDSKRGAHLMLSIARLDKLCGKPLQRIGLSATIEPLSLAAEYLSPDEVSIVAPKMSKEIHLAVTSPLAENRVIMKDTVWQELAGMVYDLCLGSRSVIAFVDGRMYAEKLAYYVNQIGGEGFARTHHGSISKEQRHLVEQDLREGKLRLLCATSSMELGIDVGDIDQVFQIGCPRSISSTLQRLGRAGHNPGRVSVMHIFPRTASEGLYCGMTAEVVRSRKVEASNPPTMCLDILAQHLVSMAVGDGYSVDEVMELLPRAYSFRSVTKEDVKDVLCMLAGDYEHENDVPVRPRILYDRIHERVEGDPYSRMLAVAAGGTIPDKGLYAAKTENGVKIGELDEEFVYEARIGDKFLLGSFAWQITNVQKDSVIVKQTNTIGAQLPFWKGEVKGRTLQTGIAFGKILNKLSKSIEQETITEDLKKLGLDEIAAKGAGDFLKRQVKATGSLPDDHTILVEHFKDETGIHQMMVHSVFGRQINAPLALLTQEAAKEIMNTNISYVEDDDGFLLFPYGECAMPSSLLQGVSPNSAKEILEALLQATPLFNITFRYNAAHALMMGVKKAGRNPLWVQRLRSAQMLDTLVKYKNHPLIRETKRECLEEYWDISGVVQILNKIQSGDIQVREVFLESPSPMSLPLRRQTEATMMYDYSPTPMGVHLAAEDALQQAKMIAPDPWQLKRVAERTRLPENEKQLHSLLMMEGDLIAGELEVPIEWLETLARSGQAAYIEPGLWIAAEQIENYKSALEEENMEECLGIVRRCLRYRGAQSLEQIGERYFFPKEKTRKIVNQLCEQGKLIESEGFYYHSAIYQQAQKETIKSRRVQGKTLPKERYAALLLKRLQQSAPLKEQLDQTLKQLCEQAFSPAVLESVILPGRVQGYRPELLDSLLAQGNIFWQFNSESELVFHRYEDIDWDAEIEVDTAGLDEKEIALYEALKKRGASFMQGLTNVLAGESPHQTLLSLAGKGLVKADSFLPVRQWVNRDKLTSGNVRQLVNARVMALTAGRWEVSRPLIKLTVEQQLDRMFDYAIILCKETVQGVTWAKALETLRVWEYTGKVRRGYFIEGLSGVQFIRDKEYTGVMLSLEQQSSETMWIPAIDPVQVWGKVLQHNKDRGFLNVPGTVVAIKNGAPIAVFERQGKVLRIFEAENLQDTMKHFVEDFHFKRLYPQMNRIVVKQYQELAVEALQSAGFLREITDYVLYRR